MPKFEKYDDARDHQISEWLSGRPWHNPFTPDGEYGETAEDGECCPDFSCCHPELLLSKGKREAFVKRHLARHTGETAMSVIKSAIIEMKAAKFDQSDIDVVHAIMRIFFDHWNCGGAVSVMIPVLNRLLRNLPLTPLTGADEEWMCNHIEEGMCQNIRCGSVFKDTRDGRIYDIDNHNWDGTFPYSPKHHSLEPIVEINSTQKS